MEAPSTGISISTRSTSGGCADRFHGAEGVSDSPICESGSHPPDLSQPGAEERVIIDYVTDTGFFHSARRLSKATTI